MVADTIGYAMAPDQACGKGHWLRSLGFAIPVNVARRILPQLRERGRVVRGYLGVSINNLDPGEAEERNIYEAMEAGKQVKKLPMSLGDALDRLERDEVVKLASGGRA